MKKICMALCRTFGQPEESWHMVRNALFTAPFAGAGLLAAYCLMAWIIPG